MNRSSSDAAMTFDTAYMIFALLVCLAGALLLPFVSHFTRDVRRRREEQEADFLREYPELADLLAQGQRR